MRRGEKLNWWRKMLGSRSGKEKQEHQNEVELTRITRWWKLWWKEEEEEEEAQKDREDEDEWWEGHELQSNPY